MAECEASRVKSSQLSAAGAARAERRPERRGRARASTVAPGGGFFISFFFSYEGHRPMGERGGDSAILGPSRVGAETFVVVLWTLCTLPLDSWMPQGRAGVSRCVGAPPRSRRAALSRGPARGRKARARLSPCLHSTLRLASRLPKSPVPVSRGPRGPGSRAPGAETRETTRPLRSSEFPATRLRPITRTSRPGARPGSTSICYTHNTTVCGPHAMRDAALTHTHDALRTPRSGLPPVHYWCCRPIQSPASAVVLCASFVIT